MTHMRQLLKTNLGFGKHTDVNLIRTFNSDFSISRVRDLLSNYGHGITLTQWFLCPVSGIIGKASKICFPFQQEEL